MSLFSGHAKTWLGTPLHSGVLSHPSQALHTLTLTQLLKKPRHGHAEKKGIKTGPEEERKREETTAEEE